MEGEKELEVNYHTYEKWIDEVEQNCWNLIRNIYLVKPVTGEKLCVTNRY